MGKAVSLLSESFLGKAICIKSLKDDHWDMDHCTEQSDQGKTGFQYLFYSLLLNFRNLF